MIEITVPYEWPERLAWLVAIATVLIGLTLMAAPARMGGLLGLAPVGGNNNGLSEIRGPVGGVWVGMGLACLLLAQPFTYFALGMAFVIAVVGRIVSFFADRTFNAHCIAVTIFESLCAYFPLKFAGSALGLF